MSTGHFGSHSAFFAGLSGSLHYHFDATLHRMRGAQNCLQKFNFLILFLYNAVLLDINGIISHTFFCLCHKAELKSVNSHLCCSDVIPEISLMGTGDLFFYFSQVQSHQSS